MLVEKYSGELVPFDKNKFKSSLLKSGASESDIDQILIIILNKIKKDTIHTQKLYSLALNELKKLENGFAARYSLKRALQELGPDGFFFEKWIGKLFTHEGSQILNGIILQGAAIKHEIDVVIKTGNHIEIAECKFRNTPESKISVTTPMYFLSRIEDLKDTKVSFGDQQLPIKKGWLITNAHLSKDSVQFTEFYKIGVISWDYPHDSSIKARVDSACLYPITCLTTLNGGEKRNLLEKNCILVKDIMNNPDLLKDLNFSDNHIQNIIKEAKGLVSNSR